MSNGTEKAIGEIKLGETTLGGKVLAIKTSYAEGIYNYKGILVTGSHAVLHNGVWMRISETDATPKSYNGIVHNLVTENHRIFSGNVEFADELETDQYEMLDLNESIAALNEEINVKSLV